MRSPLEKIRVNAGLYLLIAPAVVLLALFTYKPMYGIIIAFKDYTFTGGILGSPWVGFKHFRTFFNSYMFSSTLKNTILISLYSLAAGFPIPILLALGINQMKTGPFRKTFQVSIYLPYFISTVVMVGIIILMLSPTAGLTGILYRFLGKEPPVLMGEPGLFIHIYVWSGIWQGAGWGSIVYLAALAGVDPELYEAATVDGAARLQKIWFIDIPMLMPTVVVLLILNAGSILGVGFEKIYLMQNARNLAHSEVISTYVYKMGLINAQYSFSAAVSLFNTVINFIVLIAVNRIARRVSDNSLW
ncbi:MAG: ABC transporter permease subunit [Treponema sp.]|jgi:putative aldouronate transport system permease protein|nr:ABC transporter permease subunit [Treponema sp.]